MSDVANSTGVLSPDKNPGVKGIHERFARLGVIAAILRDPRGRERYVIGKSRVLWKCSMDALPDMIISTKMVCQDGEVQVIIIHVGDRV